MTDLAALVAVAEELGLEFRANHGCSDLWSIWVWDARGGSFLAFRCRGDITFETHESEQSTGSRDEAKTALRKWAGDQP